MLMNEHGRPRAALAAHAAAVAALLLAACSGPASPTSAAHSQPPAGARGGAPQPTSGAPGGTRQVVLGETLTSDLVLIDARTGARMSTIASGVASGDEISVTADGSTIYYEQRGSCSGQIYSMPAAGGAATRVTAGTLPAVSPDGGQLAYFRDPAASPQCAQNVAPSQYVLVVRDLRTGAEATYPPRRSSRSRASSTRSTTCRGPPTAAASSSRSARCRTTRAGRSSSWTRGP
jgi:hypothetical protein